MSFYFFDFLKESTFGADFSHVSNLIYSVFTFLKLQVNIIRDPRWGRNQETISEDPLVAGTYGAEFSLGMQYDRATGDGTPPPAEPVANELMVSATLKHVTGYSLEQYSPDGNWSEDACEYTRNHPLPVYLQA
jgi:hypothetical protein